MFSEALLRLREGIDLVVKRVFGNLSNWADSSKPKRRNVN